MSDDYLWNRAGDEDPETVRLESLLGTLGHRPRPLDLTTLRARPPVILPRPWTRFVPPLAVAAAVLLVAGGFWLSRLPQATVWQVEGVVGAPALGARPARHGVTVPEGRWVETDSASSLRLRASDVGQIEIGPRTRVRVSTSRSGDHRLSLDRGLLNVRIWAPPGQFAVDTPAATAVDLGCMYSLEVDPAGTGMLRVTSGWVGVERDGRSAFVPAGAVCVLQRDRGPRAPRFEDAPRSFANALDALDAGPAVTPGAALDAVLAGARPRDAMTLWHLLGRGDRPAREKIFDRLAALAPPPAGVDREAALSGDRAALDAWWNSYGLGDAALFRKWKMRAAS